MAETGNLKPESAEGQSRLAHVRQPKDELLGIDVSLAFQAEGLAACSPVRLQRRMSLSLRAD